MLSFNVRVEAHANEINFNQIIPFILQTEQFTVLWILFATIVLGNSAVLITLYLNKRKSRMNFFIKQLAFAGKYRIML